MTVLLSVMFLMFSRKLPVTSGKGTANVNRPLAATGCNNVLYYINIFNVVHCPIEINELKFKSLNCAS